MEPAYAGPQERIQAVSAVFGVGTLAGRHGDAGSGFFLGGGAGGWPEAGQNAFLTAAVM
jgi:hypothetical protein